MLEKVSNCEYDTKIEPSDWRYSAAIYGLKRYLNFFSIDYKEDEDALYFNSNDIVDDKYLEFVEYTYSDDMYHKVVEGLLKDNEFTDEKIKFVNDQLKGNEIMKKKFKNIKFNGNNKEDIQKIIDKNRLEIVGETFKNKKNLYRNFINTNCFLKDEQLSCRLVGYTMDMGKKGKSTAYNFNTSKLSNIDNKIFDMIPFSFTGDWTSYFINDNVFEKNLFKTNNQFRKLFENYKSENDKNTGRSIFFYSLIEVADFIDFDVEVIKKERDNDFFESMYIRRESLKILKKFQQSIDYKSLDSSIKVNDNYVNVQQSVMDGVLNETLLDNLIELLIKNNKSYLATQVIKVNFLIKEGCEEMNKNMRGAYACAMEVNKNIEPNKVASYKQKLLSSIIFNDIDRVCQILMQLSNYSNVKFDFAYSIFENYDDNKEVIYTFINTLGNKNNKGDNND